jgi:hypothetical protein
LIACSPRWAFPSKLKSWRKVGSIPSVKRIKLISFHAGLAKIQLKHMSLLIKQQDFIKRKENALAVERAIKLTETEIKELIKKQGIKPDLAEKENIEQIIDLKTNILSGLIIIWSESLIKWLLYEHGAFETEQINSLLDRVNSEQWIGAITCAFWKAFSNQPYNPNSPTQRKRNIINSNDISIKDKERFIKLYDLIEEKLIPSIVVRNKIQHGEWKYSYKKNDTNNNIEFDSFISQNVRKENVLTLKLKRKQLKAIYQIIYDLAVFKNSGNFKIDNTKTPFLFYFNKRYKQILANQVELDQADYNIYKSKLIESTIRGEYWKKKNRFHKYLKQLKRKLKTNVQ